MDYQLSLRPAEKVVAVEEKCALVREGLQRGVQPSDQRPGGPPVPQTLPGPTPGPGPTTAMVNSKGPSAGPPLPPAGSRSVAASSSQLSFTSSEPDSLSSQQTEVGVDCAGVVLYCLFCRFYDLLVMLPASCERAATRCCPAYKHVASRARHGAADAEASGADWDCGLLDSCQDTTDCLELALDMSELCYR